MENAKPKKAQELSAQELEAVSGGAYKPDGDSYSIDGMYDQVSGAVEEKLSHSGLPYFGDKDKSTYTEEYSKKTYSTPE